MKRCTTNLAQFQPIETKLLELKTLDRKNNCIYTHRKYYFFTSENEWIWKIERNSRSFLSFHNNVRRINWKLFQFRAQQSIFLIVDFSLPLDLDVFFSGSPAKRVQDLVTKVPTHCHHIEVGAWPQFDIILDRKLKFQKRDEPFISFQLIFTKSVPVSVILTLLGRWQTKKRHSMLRILIRLN